MDAIPWEVRSYVGIVTVALGIIGKSFFSTIRATSQKTNKQMEGSFGDSSPTQHLSRRVLSFNKNRPLQTWKNIPTIHKIVCIIFLIIHPAVGVVYAIGLFLNRKTILTMIKQQSWSTTSTPGQNHNPQEDSLIYDASDHKKKKKKKQSSIWFYKQQDNLDDFNNFDEKDNPPLFS